MRDMDLKIIGELDKITAEPEEPEEQEVTPVVETRTVRRTKK